MKIALNPSPITPAIAEIPVELCDILFVNEMDIIRTYQFHSAFLAEFYDVPVYFHLQWIYLMVGTFYGSLMKLQL